MTTKHLSLAAVASLLLSCAPQPRTIVVHNFADFDRQGELVEADIAATRCDFGKHTYILKDKEGREIPYQIVAEGGSPRTLLFQADVPARTASGYTLSEGTPAPVGPKVAARHVPERKDDFAWENDLAAYRMYGPALANEYPSNGVDLWLKRTGKPFMDEMYRNDLQHKQSYHIDHGQGLDCYAVGHTLGAGGIAPYTDRLWVGNHYDHQQVDVAGPLRSVFTLTYDSMRVGDAYYRQTVTVTVDAGSLLNKATVRLDGPALDSLRVAGGIFLHDTVAVQGNAYTQPSCPLIGYAEQATAADGTPAGRNYVGVYLPGNGTEIKTEGDHLLLLAPCRPGTERTYYFGGGWSEWHFPTDADWFAALQRFAQAQASPLSVSYK